MRLLIERNDGTLEEVVDDFEERYLDGSTLKMIELGHYIKSAVKRVQVYNSANSIAKAVLARRKEESDQK